VVAAVVAALAEGLELVTGEDSTVMVAVVLAAADATAHASLAAAATEAVAVMPVLAAGLVAADWEVAT